MPICHEFAGSRQGLERSGLQRRLIARNVVENASIESKKSNIHPSIQNGLLGEMQNLATLTHFQNAVPRRRPDSGHGRKFPVRTMEFKNGSDVHVRQAVAVSHQKRVIAAREILGDTQEAATGQRDEDLYPPALPKCPAHDDCRDIESAFFRARP